MTSLMYTVLSITHVASIHCAARPEISPCSCEPIYAHNYVELSCEKIDSFAVIVEKLSSKFDPNANISLKISYSQLQDMDMLSFMNMNLNIVKLRMQWNGLKTLPETAFRGLSNVEFLSVGDNELIEVPKHMLSHMPLVKTLDIGRCRISSVLQDDFRGTQMVTNLFLPSNNITRLEKGTFPPGLVTLHLGRNQIESLNGTLRDLNKMESLFINMNNITTLDNELPESNMLKLIIAQNNRLERLPESMRFMNRLETLHLQHNCLISLNGILQHAKNMNEFVANNNEIQYLGANEFQECYNLEILNLANNHIKTLNHSLLHMSHLQSANFSANEMEEFSMNEIRGLMYLNQLDLSYNRIRQLTGRQENNIDQDSFLIILNLDHNRLTSLDGALMGLNSLRILSLSYNQIERILPEDFIGLVKLEILELSHNQILTIKEMEKTFLPSLKILKVDYNNLKKLDKDFHGLPVLCQANLTNNQISSISADLVSQTRCMNHNVPGKLELLLEDNPIMCEARLIEICSFMAAQEARIRGHSQCFENDQEVCTVLPMLFTKIVVPDDIPRLIQQQPSVIPAITNSMAQVIVPAPIILNNQMRNTEERQLPPLIAPLGQPVIKPLISPSPTTTTVSETDSNNSDTLSKSEQIANTTITATLPNNPIKVLADPTTRLSTLAALASTTPLPALSLPLPMPKGSIISGEDQPLVLDIEEIPAHVDAKSFKDNVNFNSTGFNMSKDAYGNVAESADTVTVPQTEYATVEYIPNIEELMPPAPSANHDEDLAPNVKPENVHDAVEIQHQKQTNVELEDSKSNLVHDEYSAVVVTNDMESAPHSLIIPEEPPETP